ncbi:DUF523 domain-containing protein [Nocardiopsis alkaliphila]|uniref:DUF523 domain-containing protein n=1 Tax=Nocardiopsis alkaliphila TaxID=225762 RepID=UPI0003719990|nr:DUF523 domain-containing protein [Nocardiopsis alkaliphila]
MRKVLVSACLMGRRVRFDGRAKPVDDTTVERWRHEGRMVVHCPEVAGGLPVPRPPAEIEPGADASDVLAGRARVLTPEGADVTDHFVSGARAALATAQAHGATVALLKQSSPSCGPHEVYDGTFTGRKVVGEGITAHLLRAHGITVLDEDQVAEADRCLRA